MRLFMLLAVVLAPLDAWAFFCTRVGQEAGPSLSWSSRQVSYRFFGDGTEDLPGEREFDAVREGFAVWEDLVTNPADPCVPANAETDFDWVEDPARSTTDRIGFNYIDQSDNENLVIFRDDEWPYPGQTSTVIALSTVTFNSVTGAILDADIEYNSANFTFTDTDTTNQNDLLNTSVHEIGHSMGIAHNPLVSSASMFLTAPPGEVQKRDLSSDDCAAMAFKYPANAPNGYCDTLNASCGFCAPPEVVPQAVTVTQTASGGDVGGCAAAFPVALVPLTVTLLWFRRRVHRFKRG